MKKYKIIFNSSAYSKLENIFLYIAAQSPDIAASILNGIEKQITSLSRMPQRFAIVPENISYKNYQVRHFFYKKSFRIIYTIYDDIVRILDIRHSAQDSISQYELN